MRGWRRGGRRGCQDQCAQSGAVFRLQVRRVWPGRARQDRSGVRAHRVSCRDPVVPARPRTRGIGAILERGRRRVEACSTTLRGLQKQRTRWGELHRWSRDRVVFDVPSRWLRIHRSGARGAPGVAHVPWRRGRRRGWHGAPLNGSPGPPHAAALARGSGRERDQRRVLSLVRFAASCRPGHGSAERLETAGKRGSKKPQRSLVCKPSRAQVAERR